MSEDIAKYEFPNLLHPLAAALHMNNIDPGQVVIQLPPVEWWKLYCLLERKFRGMMLFDGRGEVPMSFRYMGFTFEVRR